MAKLRGELSYTGFKMAFWLGAKIKSLSCYLQKAVERSHRTLPFQTENKRDVGKLRRETKWNWSRQTLCMCGLGPLILFLWNEKNRVWWKAKTNEVFGIALKQLPCVNSSWQPLQGNSAIIFSPIFFFFPWKTEKQSNWKLTHNLMELQSLSVGTFPESVWWPRQPASFQWLLGWD